DPRWKTSRTEAGRPTSRGNSIAEVSADVHAGRRCAACDSGPSYGDLKRRRNIGLGSMRHQGDGKWAHRGRVASNPPHLGIQFKSIGKRTRFEADRIVTRPDLIIKDVSYRHRVSETTGNLAGIQKARP